MSTKPIPAGAVLPAMNGAGWAAARGILISSMRTRRTAMIWYSLAGGLLAIAIGMIYSSIVERIDLASYLNEFPPEMLAAFGMSSNILGTTEITYAGFMSFEFFPWFGIALVIYALVASGSQVASEVENGTMDMVLANPVPRWVYVISKFLGLLVPLLIIGLVCGGFAAAGGLLQGLEVPVNRFLYLGAIMGLFGSAFAGVGILLSVVTLSSQRSQMILAVIVIAQYVMDVVSKISADWEWIAPYTLFHYYDPGRILESFDWFWSPFIIFGVFAIVGPLAAVWFFQRRDLAA